MERDPGVAMHTDPDAPQRDQAWDHEARGESELERLDRNWNELLQELRVVQTGVQLLTGFLLTLPFQQRLDHAQQRGPVIPEATHAHPGHAIRKRPAVSASRMPWPWAPVSTRCPSTVAGAPSTSWRSSRSWSQNSST